MNITEKALLFLIIILFIFNISNSIRVNTTQSVLRAVTDSQTDTNGIVNKTIENTLIFQKQYRIPICDLIIKDCLKNENYEMAEYWKKYKNECIEEAVKEVAQ